MRISKSTHLVRLLQTQDVLISTLIFLLVVEAAELIGLYARSTMLNHLWLAPFVMVLSAFASTSSKPKLHGQSLWQQVMSAARYVGVVGGGLALIIFASQFENPSRTAVVSYAVLLFTALITNRAFLSWYYLHGRKEHESNFLKVLIIGGGPRAAKLMQRYQDSSDWGVQIVGVLDPDPDSLPHNTDVQSVNARGIDQLESILDNQVIDEVIVCTPRSFASAIAPVAAACEERGVCLKYMADLYDIDSKQVTVQQVGELPVLTFEPVAQNEGKLIIKRVIDLIIVLAALPVLIPLFALVAIAIKLDSPGPVFFTQPRVGLNKRIFNMIKFRSMYIDAEQRLAEIEHLNEAEGPIFKMADDPRVTRVGKLIRRSSIDELPQLINVLLGNMSVIGPRPMSLRDVEQFSQGVQRRRFSVKPGLACLREVSGRSSLSFERWLELDLKYIDEWNLGLDFQIMLRLVPSVLKGDGAS